MAKDTYIVFSEWEDDLEDLSNDEIAALTKAFFAYVKRGEKPTFSDRMVRSCWRKVKQSTDRADKAYQNKCEKNRENGKKGGAPKGNQNAIKTTETTQNNRTVEKTTETTLPDPYPDRDPYPNPERGRGRVPDAETPPADTTTTTDLKKAIVDTWNSHSFVQKIKRVDNPQKRWERTEIAIELAGGKSHFLRLLQTLDEHAYLKDQPKSGYTVMYDWFVDPENFQNVLEGKYKNTRSKFGDGWEVVEFG